MPRTRFLLARKLARWLVLSGYVLTLGSFMTANSQAQVAASNTDPRQYLEEVEGKAALDWVHGQNKRSLDILQGDPRFATLQAEARSILTAKDRIPAPNIDRRRISNFWQDQQAVRGLIRETSFDEYLKADPSWSIVLDMDALAKAENANWVYKGMNCAFPNYSLCLVSLSNGGKDAVQAREFDRDKREFVKDGFLLPEAKQDVTWEDENTLLVGTDWGPGTLTQSGYPYIVKRLKRGQSLDQAQEVFRGKPEDVSASSGTLLGPNRERRIYFLRGDTFFTSTKSLLSAAGKILALPLPAKSDVLGLFRGQVIVRLQEDWKLGAANFASGSLVSFDLKAFEQSAIIAKATLIYAPGPRESLDEVGISQDALVITTLENVKGAAYWLRFHGGNWRKMRMDLPENVAIGISSSDVDDRRVFLSVTGFLTPSSIWLASFEDHGRKAPTTSLTLVKSTPPRFDASQHVVEQLEARSKDGTMVPYFVVRPKNLAFDGSAPTLLYAYGGFEISLPPSYSGVMGKLWLERGGVYVLANIRGGGEFGPAWHQAGLKTKRQVVYDDFIAVGEDLQKRKITSPAKLGIMGGSNGGLLMGVMFTQRPDLWRALVIQVPLLDMLRYHLLLAGASWVDEYGSPDVPVERAWLEKLSPYHNLRDGLTYPMPFFLTSTKDDRVHPGHARKMAALLESKGLPFLYYENTDGGHSAAANLDETAKRQALEYTYLIRQLMDAPR